MQAVDLETLDGPGFGQLGDRLIALLKPAYLRRRTTAG